MLTPAEGKVAIMPLFDPDMSPTGLLYIPEQAKERCDQGIVKYVGSKCKLVKPGDFVIFPGYSGQTVMIDGEGILIFMAEDAITACIEGETLNETEVEGLYFKGMDGTFFRATVQASLELVTLALQEAPWRRDMKSVDMIDHRPKELK